MKKIRKEEADQVSAPISKQWLRNSAASLFVSKIVASAAVLVAGMLLLRYLEPSDYGFYQVVVSISSFTLLAFSFGFSPVVSRFVPELLERGKSRTAAKFILATLAVRLAAMSIVVPIGYIFFDSIGEFFGLAGINEFGPLFVVLLVVGVYFGTGTGPIILGAYSRQVEMGLTTVISAFLRIILIIIVINKDYGLIGVLAAIASVEITMALVYAIRSVLVIRSQSISVDSSITHTLVRRSVRYASPYWVMAGLSFFEGRYGMIFVISSSLGTAAAGNYAFVFVVLQFGSILNPVFTLNSLINNVIVRRSVHDDQRLLLARGQKMFLTLSLYTGVPVALYLLLIREPLSQVFGFEQAGTGWLFLWAGVFFVTNAAKLAYGNIYSQLEVPQYKLLFGLLGVIGIGAAFVVVEDYGIVGVAAVAGMTSTMSLLVQHWISKQILGIPVGVYPAVLFKIGVINVLAGTAMFALVSSSDKFLIIAFSTSFIFVVVYGISTIFIRPFTSEDMKLFRSIAPGIKLPTFRSSSR